MSRPASPSRIALRIAHAGLKKIGGVFRSAGMTREHPQWQERAQVCSQCPLCVIDKRHAYCGKPFLRKVERDEATEGCGCPILAKAKDPGEHCPRNRLFEASNKSHPETCDCTWCTTLRQH